MESGATIVQGHWNRIAFHSDFQHIRKREPLNGKKEPLNGISAACGLALLSPGLAKVISSLPELLRRLGNL